MATYHIFDNETQRGPFERAQIESMWNHGALTANALYFSEDTQEWKPINLLLKADESNPRSGKLDQSAKTLELVPVETVPVPSAQPMPAHAVASTNVVISQDSRGYNNLFIVACILVALVCGIAFVPFLGFLSWLIVLPLSLVTFILSIVIFARGGIFRGLIVLLSTIILVPLCVLIAPFLSTFITTGAAGLAVAAATSKSPPKHSTDSEAAAHQNEIPAAPEATSPSENADQKSQTKDPPIGKLPTADDLHRQLDAAIQQSAEVDRKASLQPQTSTSPNTNAVEGEPTGSNRGLDTSYSPDSIDRDSITATTPQLKGEMFPETRTRLLSSSDIANWSDEKIQYAINEMYARKDVDFSKKAIKQIFLAFDWYTPVEGVTFDDAEKRFSGIERANLDFLAGQRKQTGLQPEAQFPTDAGEADFVKPDGSMDGDKIGRSLTASYQQCLAKASTKVMKEQIRIAQRAWIVYSNKTETALNALNKPQDSVWKIELKECILRGRELQRYFDQPTKTINELKGDLERSENALTATYKEVIDRLGESDKRNLIEAERAWVDYKEKDLKANAIVNTNSQGIQDAINVVNDRNQDLRDTYW